METAPSPCKKFKKPYSLQNLLNSGLLSDVTVVSPGGCVFKLHRAILAVRSPFFSDLFRGDWHETKKGSVTMKVEDPLDLFPRFVSYFYTGEFTVDRKTAVAAHTLADYMRIDELKEFCSEFIDEDMLPPVAMSYLHDALRFKQDDIKKSAIGVVAIHFSKHGTLPFAEWTSFCGLPVDVILAILRHPDLYVACERHVLDLVHNYCLEHHPPLSASKERDLINEIRFAFLDSAVLAGPFTVGTRGIVTNEYLFPHFRHRMLLLSQKDAQGTEDAKFKPRESYMGKSEGIPGGTTVDVPQGKASSTSSGSYASITSEDSSAYFGTYSGRDQWVEIIYSVPFVPGSYQFRNNSLRNWNFEGSVDGTTYTLLRSHHSATADRNQISKFTLPYEGFFTPYRYFRIRDTDQQGIYISAFRVFPVPISFWPVSP